MKNYVTVNMLSAKKYNICKSLILHRRGRDHLAFVKWGPETSWKPLVYTEKHKLL